LTNSRTLFRIASLVAIGIFVSTIFLLPIRRAQNSADPWTKAESVEAPNLIKELNDPKTAPTVLFVGFQRLYTAGHIKAAQFHGTGGNPEALKELKAWAATLPTTTNLVIYCGCCPMEHCPNVRPPFTALREMGFSKLRVLILPTSFEVDWTAKGYPYDKGK
jgi:thiosulfate/3-mercaptopyruvate sulfurtransferase